MYTLFKYHSCWTSNMLIFYGPCNNARDSEILVCIFAIFLQNFIQQIAWQSFLATYIFVSSNHSICLFEREVAKGLMKYQPDIIISVHPLMQHVPLRILRAKGLLKKIVFTTVITDLSTCHPTWSVLHLWFMF